MQKNILITGNPKSGKSTLLQNLIKDIPNKVGFFTKELLGKEGRIGFEIETYSGDKKVLAHVDFGTPYKVSNYFVDIQNLESVIPEVSSFKENDFLYLDEIGQMQLYSDKFKELVLKYLEAKNTCLMTFSCVFADEFIKSLKERKDIILVEISTENREEKEKFIRQLLRKVEKAKGYISEPERFTRIKSDIELQSEHGIRILSLDGKRWKCTCDFFREYQICSHTIAVQEIFS